MAGRVYVGNLPTQIVERDLEEQFGRFGTLRSVWVARKPPGFAFVDFEDPRDADDAVRKMDGFQQWRVEMSRKGQATSRLPPRGPPRGRDRSLSPRRRYRSPSYSPPRRSYRRSPSYEPRPRRSPSYSPRRSLSPIRARRRSRSRS